jgi:glucose/arabinose dehydrogenase
MWKRCVKVLCGLVISSAGTTVGAAIQLQPVVTGLSSPLYVTHARDGSDRLFIVEQGGRIKVLQPGSTTPAVFLDITAKVLAGGEQGLLGLTFHPAYPANRRFFVNYTRQLDGATVVAEYQTSLSDPNVADATETILITIPQPFANHNGGMIEFGPDGFLYIGMGDGGSANDPGNRAQNVDELLGKMLRIDVDHANGAIPYSSPSDNPFFGAAPGRDEIFAAGLRNPFRFSFDRMTGLLYAGDVGQGAREEIDIVSRGGNYGWRVFEGTLCTNLDPGLCNPANFMPPIAEYDHSLGRCAIIGGYVYRGAQGAFPAGAYIYGDLCTGEILQLLPAIGGGTQTVLLDTALNGVLSSFGEDESGELYVVGLGGTVDRLVATAQSGGGSAQVDTGGGGGGCFIATAAYGSPLAMEIQILRDFRDRYLLTNVPGRLVVAAYYQVSPPLARWIATHDPIRVALRGSLRPIVAWARLSLVSPVGGFLLFPGGLVGLFMGVCALARLHCRHRPD